MRKPIALLAAVAVVLGVASAFPVQASALTPGIAFSAANLPTWQVNSEVYGLASVHGKVVVGGNFTQLTPPVGGSGTTMNITGLAILNAETGNPDGCQLPITFSAGTPVVRSVIASPDGNTIYVGGDFTTVGGVAVARVAAIDPVACKVLPLRISGINGQVIGMVATATTIYFAGQFTAVGGQTRMKFAAATLATGALLPWAPSAAGSVTTDGTDVYNPNGAAFGRAIAVSPDGTKVAIGGDFFTINGQDDHSIAVVDSNTGAIVQAFPRGFIPDTSVTKTIWSDGTNFYVGNEGTGGGVFDGRLSVSWASLTQNWRDTCLGATQALITYQGTLYIASHAHNCDSNNAFNDGTRNFFMAETASNASILQWFPTANDGIGEGIGPRALTIGTGSTTGKNYLWYGGEFTQVNGKAQQGLTRFGPDDTTVPPVPAPTAEALTSNSVQVRFRTVVDPDDGILTYSVYRNGSTTPIWTGQASSTWWSRPQVTFVDNNVVAGTTYSYRVTANDGTNTSALSAATTAKAVTKANDYPSQVIADGANLYWRMDESTTTNTSWAQDKSGQTTTGLNGIYKYITVSGEPAGITPGVPGAIAGSSDTADHFSGANDGSGGYVYSDQQLPAPTTYSIETWINTTTTSGGKIIGYGNGRPETNSGTANLSGSYDRHIYMDNAGHLIFGVYAGGTQTIQSSKTYNDGAWHYIVGTQGPSGMALYVDGKKVGTNPTTAAQSYIGNWHVGGDNLNGWPNQPSSNYFAGNIDDTAVYPAPLTPQQVANHYQLAGGQITVPTAPVDAYGAAVFNANPSLYWRLNESSGTVAKDSSFDDQSDGTYGSGVSLGTNGAVPTGTAVTLDGTQNGVISTAGPANAPSAFSSEAWFKTTTTTGGKIIGFEDTPTGNGSNYDKQIYLTNAGRLVFGVYNGAVQDIESSSSYNDGQWHHVVGTQGSDGMTLYVDGAAVGTNPNTTNQSFTGYWRAGGGNISGWPDQPQTFELSGSLDEIAVYPYEISAATVANHYQLGIGTPSDTTPPTAPTAVTATVTGNSVALTWTASTDNVGVTGYSVYRDTTSNFTPNPLDLVSASPVTGTSFTDTAVPTGSYFYKVVSTDAAGNVSSASASASASVLPPPDTTAPSAPTGVTASVTGSSVALSWAPATDNVGVTGYVVYRDTTPGFAPSAANQIGTPTGTAFTDNGLATATYYYQIVATDLAGNLSSPSASTPATVLPPPDTTAPSSPTGVSTSVTGTSVSLSWTASTDNVGVTGYTVYRGSTAGFAPSASNAVGTSATTTFADSGLAVGTYFYKVTASDAAGNASDPSSSASATIAPAPDTTAPSVPTGVSATVSNTSVALSWSASTDNVGVTGYTVYRATTAGFTPSSSNQVGAVTGTSFTDSGVSPGTYYYEVTASDAAANQSSASTAVMATIAPIAVNPVTLTVNPTEDTYVAQSAPTTNYGTNTQLSSSGSATAGSFSYLRFSLPAAPSGTTLSGATISVRTSTDPTAGSLDAQTFSILNGTWSASTTTWNTRPTAIGAQLGTLSGATATNSPYTATLDATQLSSLAGSSVSFVLSDGVGSDNLRLFSQDATTASQRPVLTLTYSQASGPIDTSAPTVPANVATTVAGSTSTVTWAASSDNVGVTGYSVYRGSTAGFAINAASKLADTSTLSYSDSGLAAGTYYYEVTARDAAGNQSSASVAAAANIAAAPTTATLTVYPSEDAMVLQATPTTNYGSDLSLSSRGSVGTTAISSYLKFVLPAAPSGTHLVGAVLQVRTSTDATAATADTQTFSLIPATFSESTITWNTQPSATGAVLLGTLTGTTAINTAYLSTWDAGQLAPLGGNTISVSLTSAGSDNLRLFSANNTNAALRPVLTLTYSS